jgi:putative membrane protein
MNANRAFGTEDRRRIEEAVAEVEANTSAEIVCAVSTASGRYDRADGVVGLGGAVLLLILVHWLHEWLVAGGGAWGVSALTLGWQVGAVVIGFIGGSLLAPHLPALRRLLVSQAVMAEEVQGAAARVFQSAAVGETAGATGLLVYVSLFERRVVILADQSVLTVLGHERVAQLRDLAVAELKDGRFAEAFLRVIREASPRLAAALPAARRMNPNELPDRLLLFHPRPG